jgi:hypothetical protein
MCGKELVKRIERQLEAASVSELSTRDLSTISEQTHVSNTTIYDIDLIFSIGEVHGHVSAPSVSIITVL